jgi:MOSC domain-containing protein YiiM
MDFSRRHDRWLQKLPASPTDEGRVTRLVIRPGAETSGERECPESIELSPEQGILGDRWHENPERCPGSQVSLINTHMIAALAGEIPTELSGDNLHVDLDLSEANLPIGTRLVMGSAVLQISDVTHRPCESFYQRYGARASKRVARGNATGLRGRGVLCLVTEAGTIRVGDQILVQRP